MDSSWGFPENVSLHGGQIDTLFWVMTWVTVPMLLGVVGFVIWCLVRYRAKEGIRAAYVTGFKTALGTWALASVLLLLELPMDYFQEGVWAQATVGFPDPAEATVVQVYAEQFAWNFRYPGKDGKFGTADDVTTVNNLHAPVDKPVLCVIRSRDVIHSFWLPQFRVKIDAMPGITHRAWFVPVKAGTYELACAELCGLGHYRMRALVKIETVEEFGAWLRKMDGELEEFGPGDEAKKWELWDAAS